MKDNYERRSVTDSQQELSQEQITEAIRGNIKIYNQKVEALLELLANPKKQSEKVYTSAWTEMRLAEADADRDIKVLMLNKMDAKAK
jgi:hypothetical protein